MDWGMDCIVEEPILLPGYLWKKVIIPVAYRFLL